VRGDVADAIARLERLATDLDRIGSGERPSADDLATAPLLARWRLATRSAPCLVGLCSDHPRLHGPLIYTSELWAIAPKLGWARTWSRFYRLGTPAEGIERSTKSGAGRLSLSRRVVTWPLPR
jgi:hypothetical protein